MPRELAVGTVLSIAAQRAVHDTLVNPFDSFVINAHALDSTWPEPFHNYVGVLYKPIENLKPLFRLQIDYYAFLIAVDSVIGVS